MCSIIDYPPAHRINKKRSKREKNSKELSEKQTRKQTKNTVWQVGSWTIDLACLRAGGGMETDFKDDIPASEEPVQVPDQTLSHDEPTRVLEPEIQDDRKPDEKSVIPIFDLTKLSYELQQGYRIYVELLADSNRNVTWPFLDPVDAESLGLWDYYERIKEPMCFATIGSKLTEYKYNSITEVVADMRLILENCYRYNGPDHWVSKLGQKLEKILEQKLALLNRSLRDKVTLLATMSLNQDLPLVAGLEASGRRRSSRQNYLSMVNGENSSSLVNHVKIQEESVEKERRKQREKEKKVANQALLQDLGDWEEKELTPEIMNQLHSMWEIPSTGSFLYLVRNILGLEDINLTEFELSFIYPNKSSLLARIFTALLVTPHQRKSLYKKPVMTFKRWESKLKDKLDVWYKVAEKEDLYAVSIQYGIDLRFFDILGNEKNPLEEKSYLDLTLFQRVWMLKTLCDVCFHKDYDLREKVNSCDFMEQRELFLGIDADNHSYIYFPVFQTTDIRVYQHDQLEVPKLNINSRKEPSPPPPPDRKKARKTPSKPSTPARPGRPSRLRQLRGETTPEEKEIKEESQPSPEPDEVKEMESKPNQLPAFEAEDGFKLACHDIETLKALSERFSEPLTPAKKRGRRPKVPPPRKRCEVELHETLLALLQELEKYEGAFSKNYTKARIKIMKESLEPEAVEPEEPEETPEPEPMEEWGSELSDEDDGAKQDAKDEDFRIEDEFGVSLTLDDKQSKLDNEIQSISDESSENGSIKAMHRISARYKRKRKSSKTEDNAENCSIALQTPNPRLKKKAKKWSPTRETVLPKSVSSPSVVISAVSAEESVRAATMPRKDVKKRRTEAGDEPRSMSPKTILVNSLGEALKRAKTSPVKPPNSITNSNVVNITDTSIQGAANTDVSSTIDSSSLLAQSLRKRILVSPEGKAHEVKPCVTSTTTPMVTPQERPLLQLKTAVTKGEIAKSVAGVTLTLSRTIGMVSQNRVMLSTGTAPTTVTSTIGNHQRPNILSHSRKQVVGKPVVVAQVTTGNPVQGNMLIPTCAASHHHTYAISSTSVNQGSQQSSGVVAPTSTAIRMVQIIPNSKQANIQTANSLLATSVKTGTGFNVTTKTGATSGPSGVKVTPPKTPQGVTPRGLLSKAQTLTTAQVSSTQVSASATPQPAGIAVKTQAGKQTLSQTKVVFIPASSVDAKSPLASFKPQTLTTTGGQSIYGYAVVVPPGTPEEVNAVISSALRKPTSVPVKPSSTPMQQKQVTAPGKLANQAGILGKAQNTNLGISTLPGSKLRPSVGNIPQPRSGAATSTIQPRPGVTISAALPRPAAPSAATQPRPGVSTNTEQPRLGVLTTSAQPRPGNPIITTQSHPGVPSNIAQLRPAVTMNATQLSGAPPAVMQPRLSAPIKTTQPLPGVPTITTQPSSGVPTTTAQLHPVVAINTTQTRPVVQSVATQPRPCVPTTTAQLHPAVSINTTQPRSGAKTVATQPVRYVPTSTTHLGAGVPVSVAHVLVGSNTKQPILSVSASFTSNTNVTLGSGSKQSRSSVDTSTVQPRTGFSTNQSSSATSNSNRLLGKSILTSSFGTTFQNPPTINVTASNCPKDLPSSSTIRGDAVITSREVAITSSIAQSTTVSVPRTPSVARSTKGCDSAPTGEQTGRLNALGNYQNSCQIPVMNNTKGNNSEGKNGPVNHLDVSSTSSELVNACGSATSRNSATEISTPNVNKETLSTNITSVELPLPDKLIVKDEDQKIASYCNGLSIHPTFKSIDSIRNIKCLESSTPLEHVSSVNGIPEVLNSKAPSLCSTTIHSPTVTSN